MSSIQKPINAQSKMDGLLNELISDLQERVRTEFESRFIHELRQESRLDNRAIHDLKISVLKKVITDLVESGNGGITFR